jgi:hypothetical protein
MIHLVRRAAITAGAPWRPAQPIMPETKAPGDIIPPVAAHPHTEAASITGGYVYHGSRFPELRDAYIYGDYETGKIWALWHDGTQVTRREEIADTAAQDRQLRSKRRRRGVLDELGKRHAHLPPVEKSRRRQTEPVSAQTQRNRPLHRHRRANTCRRRSAF